MFPADCFLLTAPLELAAPRCLIEELPDWGPQATPFGRKVMFHVPCESTATSDEYQCASQELAAPRRLIEELPERSMREASPLLPVRQPVCVFAPVQVHC